MPAVASLLVYSPKAENTGLNVVAPAFYWNRLGCFTLVRLWPVHSVRLTPDFL